MERIERAHRHGKWFESPREYGRGQLEERNPDFSPIPAQMAILYDRLGQPEAARKKTKGERAAW